VSLTKLIQSGKGHEGIKGSRSVWLGASNFIMTTGLNKVGIMNLADLYKARFLTILNDFEDTISPIRYLGFS
jgi:hypothetical protein